MAITTFPGGGISRRGLLAAAAAVTAAVPLGASHPRPAAAAAPRLTLPPPTGPCPVGTVALHLVDRSRPDPVAGPGHFRELMAQVWYPARDVRRHPRAPWMDAAPLARLLAGNGFDPGAVAAPLTWAHTGAPVRHTGERLPVIVYSHGAHDHRSDTTIVVQELASHGYAVVTVDHTYDAYGQFPDGRVIVPLDDPALTPWDFAADLRHLLDVAGDLAAGRNPDAGRRPLPAGLAGSLDAGRIGAWGWSKGGTAVALLTASDRRVKAGLSFDGPMISQPRPSGGIDRPFMLMTADNSRAANPAVAEFWTHLTGWRLAVQADGAVHPSYCDLQWLMPQLARIVGMSDADLRSYIGTLEPARAVRIQQAYPRAFFDRHLRGRPARLLDGPARAFPEVKYIP